MKASDVQELQLKLQKLQIELNKNRNNESSEEVTQELIAYEDRSSHNGNAARDNLRIDDFEISTTLGNPSPHYSPNSVKERVLLVVLDKLS